MVEGDLGVGQAARWPWSGAGLSPSRRGCGCQQWARRPYAAAWPVALQCWLAMAFNTTDRSDPPSGTDSQTFV